MVLDVLLALLMHRELRAGGQIARRHHTADLCQPRRRRFSFRTILYEGGWPSEHLARSTWNRRQAMAIRPGMAEIQHDLDGRLALDPFVFVISLAGLQNLPQDVTEAAEVDGASSWQVFRYVTLPLMAPILWLIVLLRTIDAFKVFDIPSSLTLGGPGRSTEYWSLFNYRTARKNLNYGDAAVQAFLLLIIVVLIVTLLWNKIQKVYEEEGLKG